jgi:hypothetical protein
MRWHDVRLRRVAANLQFLPLVIRHGLHTGTVDSFDNLEASRAEEIPGRLGQKLLEAGASRARFAISSCTSPSVFAARGGTTC